jgi:hypothetical protein
VLHACARVRVVLRTLSGNFSSRPSKFTSRCATMTELCPLLSPLSLCALCALCAACSRANHIRRKSREISKKARRARLMIMRRHSARVRKASTSIVHPSRTRNKGGARWRENKKFCAEAKARLLSRNSMGEHKRSVETRNAKESSHHFAFFNLQPHKPVCVKRTWTSVGL